MLVLFEAFGFEFLNTFIIIVCVCAHAWSKDRFELLCLRNMILTL